ncbi:hypothetical protein [Streptomyces sp. SID1121]|uniref:hypothetical protein n=1 Tax=Streptomyces sp. SID1121 TaxID=3425888 RepID=UPI00405637EC
MPDDDVIGVVAELIESHFRMSLPELRGAVAAAPQANPQASEVVRWYGLLVESQKDLELAEDALVAVLMTEPGELGDPAMDLAHRVNAAVTARDGRVTVIRYLLDPPAPGPHVWRGSSRATNQGPALLTSQPAAPATSAAPARGVAR